MINVRRATDSDLAQIVEISSSLTLDALGCGANERGFLVSGYDETTYRGFLDPVNTFFVAEIGGEIAGFLLALHPENFGAQETVNNLLKWGLNRPFIVIKQIAVAANFARQGVGKKLYDHLMDLHGDKDWAAAIVTEPRNATSIHFHERYGFTHVLNIMPPADIDGQSRPRGIWLRASGAGAHFRFQFPNNATAIEHLFEKQHALIALYLHEDNLNWVKFEHLVGYMLAHFAGLAFMVDNRAEQYALIGALFLIATGFMTTYLFHKKLDSGTRYMAAHKKQLIEVENLISRFDIALPRCLNGHDSDNMEFNVQEQSATVNILKKIPFIIFILWGTVSIFSVAYILSDFLGALFS